MIVLRRTSRGFLRGDFQDLNGDSCSIQESSSAQAPAIWLGANHGTHHHVTGDCLARMHLSIPLCEALIPLLRHFIEHGELPEQRGDPMTSMIIPGDDRPENARMLIADRLEKLRKELFVPDLQEEYKLSFVARLPGKPEMDILVTEDDQDGLIEITKRRFAP